MWKSISNSRTVKNICYIETVHNNETVNLRRLLYILNTMGYISVYKWSYIEVKSLLMPFFYSTRIKCTLKVISLIKIIPAIVVSVLYDMDSGYIT